MFLREISSQIVTNLQEVHRSFYFVKVCQTVYGFYIVTTDYVNYRKTYSCQF